MVGGGRSGCEGAYDLQVEQRVREKKVSSIEEGSSRETRTSILSDGHKVQHETTRDDIEQLFSFLRHRPL
jgi:hypothetical protein